MNMKETPAPFVSTRNACKLCAPLGACFAMRGIEGCIPLIHGSQGCSTYIRRYGISHFREPIDIASSNFTESTAIFGGRDNLVTAIDNVTRQYHPTVIGITSTCLSETIGENVPMYLRSYLAERDAGRAGVLGLKPVVFYASTPSYRGTHMDGFHEAVYAAVCALARPAEKRDGRINLVSGFVSAEDLRELHRILRSYGRAYTLIPDYSKTLDGVSWETYQKLPEGGTPIAAIAAMSEACATIALGQALPTEKNAAHWLEKEHAVPAKYVDLPIGIGNTDVFFDALTAVAQQEMPAEWVEERGRVVDAYIDGHKYVAGKRAILYGEEDFVVAMAGFLDEIGMVPVIAATGAVSSAFSARIEAATPHARGQAKAVADTDFSTMLEIAEPLHPDIVIGSSKGYYLARNLKIPMVRCGFPIHDRIGGHRILHLGYRGTLNLFERICNAVMEAQQLAASSGWTYI